MTRYFRGSLGNHRQLGLGVSRARREANTDVAVIRTSDEIIPCCAATIVF
jgi:hypothetical protein